MHRSVVSGLLGAACCLVVLAVSPARAASEEVLAAARACAQRDWVNEAGHARAQAYRETVDCLSALYIRVAAVEDGGRSDARLETEIRRRLRQLEGAYHASRDMCRLRETLGLEDRGCGTGHASAHEFVRILKTMIVDADAGPVRRDPALGEALGLD